MHGAHEHPPSGHRTGQRRALLWLATVVLLALAAACYWYGTAHGSHITQAFTWALVLACPLMHLFGHGHGAHRHRNADAGALPTQR